MCGVSPSTLAEVRPARLSGALTTKTKSSGRCGDHPDLAFLWQNGVTTWLGVVGYGTVARAINEPGLIVGTRQQFACLWENGALKMLANGSALSLVRP